MADLHLDDETTGQMLRIVAHDLRNPLAVIISNLGYLQSALANAAPDVAETLVDTVTSCEDLKHIISNLELLGTTLKQAEVGGGVSFEVLPSSMEIVTRCQALARSHGVEIEAVIAPLSGVWGRGKPPLFEAALSNMLRNGIQHAPPGSKVRFELGAEKNRCFARVLDTGQAIDEADVFSPAGQIHAKTSGTGRYGRGFGLLIAKLAADGIGAQLSLGVGAPPYVSSIELSFDRAVSAPPPLSGGSVE